MVVEDIISIVSTSESKFVGHSYANKSYISIFGEEKVIQLNKYERIFIFLL